MALDCIQDARIQLRLATYGFQAVAPAVVRLHVVGHNPKGPDPYGETGSDNARRRRSATPNYCFVKEGTTTLALYYSEKS